MKSDAIQLEEKNYRSQKVKRVILNSLQIVLICLSVNTICFVILLLNWGKNQDISPNDLSVLKGAMSARDCAANLSVGPQTIAPYGRARRVNVSSVGLGAFFVEQYRVDLEFDTADELIGIHVQRAYCTGESWIDVKIEGVRSF